MMRVRVNEDWTVERRVGAEPLYAAALVLEPIGVEGAGRARIRIWQGELEHTGRTGALVAALHARRRIVETLEGVPGLAIDGFDVVAVDMDPDGWPLE